MSVTQEQLKAELHYSPETGVFTRVWSKQRPDCVGKQTGVVNKRHMKLYVSVGNRQYLAHRLAWLYMTGAWPALEIDHIDGDGLNNSFANLRQCDSSQNKANRLVCKTNKSGFKGVFAHGERYRAFIQFRGKRQYLGTFDTAPDAAAAYRAAELNVFGEFARGAQPCL